MDILKYGKFYPLNNKSVKNIFNGPILIEEYILGEWFSFGVLNGQLKFFSKRAEVIFDEANKRYHHIITALQLIHSKREFKAEYIYRCVIVDKLTNKVCGYGRLPKYHLVICDIENDSNRFLNYIDKKNEAQRLRMECVNVFFDGLIGPNQKINHINSLKNLKTKSSLLMNNRIKGITIKNYCLDNIPGRVGMAKVNFRL